LTGSGKPLARFSSATCPGLAPNRAAFEAWTQSEAFRAAHHRAGENKPVYLGHPQFEGFEVRQTVGMGEAQVA
jgi:hypothetical protein